MKNQVRLEIEKMIEAGSLEGLLKKAGELHGHFCNFLAYGVIAGLYAIKKLGVSNTGMEEVIAIIETNNCFSDGVQMVTGCSLGNNALIYRDYGKTAVTVSKRDGQAVRLVLKPEFEDSRGEKFPEAYDLFYKLVARREKGSPEEYGLMMQLFAKMSFEELRNPIEEIFLIKQEKIQLPAFAPIFDTIKCEICKENIVKARAIEKDNKFYCIPCAKAPFFELNGSGIVEMKE
jgi:formylmethanofuran dehydrogenase subunit E